MNQPESLSAEHLARWLYARYFDGKGIGLDTYCEDAAAPWTRTAAAVRALVEAKVREAVLLAWTRVGTGPTVDEIVSRILGA